MIIGEIAKQANYFFRSVQSRFAIYVYIIVILPFDLL